MPSNPGTDRRRRVLAVGFALCAACIGLPGSGADARDLDFEERVAAQRAIEEVYWRHRTWPKENPASKPPLLAVLSDEAIRARVEDYLAKSSALETRWHKPVTAEHLQAELDRMSTRTRDARMLQELYAALGNDAFLIAETLARQTLVDRRVRDAYSADERIHGALKEEVQRQLDGVTGTAGLNALRGYYEHVLDARVQHTAVWTGAEMIVWGGYDGVTLIETGVRYNPATDSWTAMADTNAPVPYVTFPTAVWTGTEVIVFGWSAAVSGRYDPSTDTWTAMSTEGGPSPRALPTAVWTGTEMIVWGGTADPSFLNTGGRYDPATDTWTATSTGAGVPTPRIVHTAVWTGTAMIVWGGVGADGVTNTGHRYDTATDAWAPISGTNAPAPRRSFTAAWTGEEMIVWGGAGISSGSYLNTGGRYDPATDSWSATSRAANVPRSRFLHTAVWTGTRMIVWGGFSNGYLDTGGLYDPVTDSWTTTSNGFNTPESRWHHTAVWTGTEMIVWGGEHSPIGGPALVLNTGGRYDPATNAWLPTSTEVSAPTAPSASDLDGDGRPDIVWRKASGDTGAWSMNGTTVEGWLALPTEPPTSGWQIEGLGNFDAAGDADVLWRNALTGETGVWHVAGGSVTGWAWLPSEPPDSGWQIQGVGDFDGNGISDVLWRNVNTGETGIWAIDAPSSGPAVVGWYWMPTEPPDSGWEIQGVGDLDGDGSSDVLWRHTTTGEVGAWVCDGTDVTGWVSIATEPPDTGWEIRAVVDLTGDAASEVLWRHAGTGRIGAWLIDEASVTGWVWLPTEPPSSGWEIEGPR